MRWKPSTHLQTLYPVSRSVLVPAIIGHNQSDFHCRKHHLDWRALRFALQSRYCFPSLQWVSLKIKSIHQSECNAIGLNCSDTFSPARFRLQASILRLDWRLIVGVCSYRRFCIALNECRTIIGRLVFKYDFVAERIKSTKVSY